MPSLSEAPSGGARAFCLLLRFSKVSRCKSGTIGSRYRSNGYAPNQTASENYFPADFHKSQAKKSPA
ncbi:hypothetical protein SRABI06_02256 [Pseudomonas brassicacearum]|nr:hypothetical protein SRABI06_02256 [Pseudomonas brassicacearum]